MNYITSDATEGVPEVRKNIGVRPNLFLVALTASSICLTGVREFCTFLDKKKNRHYTNLKVYRRNYGVWVSVERH